MDNWDFYVYENLKSYTEGKWDVIMDNPFIDKLKNKILPPALIREILALACCKTTWL